MFELMKVLIGVTLPACVASTERGGESRVLKARVRLSPLFLPLPPLSSPRAAPATQAMTLPVLLKYLVVWYAGQTVSCAEDIYAALVRAAETEENLPVRDLYFMLVTALTNHFCLKMLTRVKCL